MTLEEVRRKLELWLAAENALIQIIRDLSKAEKSNHISALTLEAKNQIQVRESAQKSYFEAVHAWNSGL